MKNRADIDVRPILSYNQLASWYPTSSFPSFCS